MTLKTAHSLLSVKAVVALAPLALIATHAHAQPGWVLSHQKISDTAGGFKGILGSSDKFGRVASLGDLDGDGVTDLAVGAWRDDDGGTDRGAVWILFLNTDGTVKSHQKISDTAGGFTGILDDVDVFGVTVASLGDLDGAGPSVLALAVGAAGDDDGGTPPNADRGAVWILFLNVDTTGPDPVVTVKSHHKISDTSGDLPPGALDDVDNFGSVGSLGDLDGDGVVDLAVGVWRDDDGGIPPNADRGAVWILFLNPDGTVNHHQKISDTQGGFKGMLVDGDGLGSGLASLGDLDGDGVSDLAVGAAGVDFGPAVRGAVWILFLNTDGTVKSHQKISDNKGGFTGTLNLGDDFGVSLAWLDDLDGDGVGDLAVGAFLDDDGGLNRGAVWILFLNTDGTVKSHHQKISSTQGGFTGILDDGDLFGWVASLGDLDGAGPSALALSVGAQNDDDGGFNRGAVWVLFLDGPCYADCDPNGVLDIFDFLCFQNSFVSGEPYACDCDPDPVCDIFDFLCFQNAFVGGCP